VRIAFFVAKLNDLMLLSCDIGNAYLNAPCREKIWFQAGKECGSDEGKVMVLVRALYGLKRTGASWRAMFSRTIKDLGFASTMVDPDVYIRKNFREDGVPYYEMILVYVDDVLCVSHEPAKIMTSLGEVYELKEGSVQEPTLYLGANIKKIQLLNGREVWSMSSDLYMHLSIATVNELLHEDGRELRTGKRQGKTPLPYGYRPELDTTNELTVAKWLQYMQLIGILRWAVELGRIDIAYDVAIMSQYSALPREGHLEAVYHFFLYLSKHSKSRLVFDDTTRTVDEVNFMGDVDWRDFYGEIVEENPIGMQSPLGRSVQNSCFVDANHAGNVVTRQSHTGILIYVQNAPIIWYSKKQNMVEASTFGSELVALRIAKDMIVALRIKLKMFGVPLEGLANVFCDNQGVVKNTSIPQSTLNKKHNAINYHSVREAVAAGIIRVAKEDSETNLADILTKRLSADRQKQLLSGILIHCNDSSHVIHSNDGT
jgi:Reverse transcriptase (RNA-dependent DNA polymerase)